MALSEQRTLSETDLVTRGHGRRTQVNAVDSHSPHGPRTDDEDEDPNFQGATEELTLPRGLLTSSQTPEDNGTKVHFVIYDLQARYLTRTMFFCPDPYIKLSLRPGKKHAVMDHHDQEHKTTVINSTVNPSWFGYQFDFEALPSDMLEIEVKDKFVSTRPTFARFLGYRSLPVRKLVDKVRAGTTSNVYFLQHKNPNENVQGQVSFQIDLRRDFGETRTTLENPVRPVPAPRSRSRLGAFPRTNSVPSAESEGNLYTASPGFSTPLADAPDDSRRGSHRLTADEVMLRTFNSPAETASPPPLPRPRSGEVARRNTDNDRRRRVANNDSGGDGGEENYMPLSHFASGDPGYARASPRSSQSRSAPDASVAPAAPTAAPTESDDDIYDDAWSVPRIQLPPLPPKHKNPTDSEPEQPDASTSNHSPPPPFTDLIDFEACASPATPRAPLADISSEAAITPSYASPTPSEMDEAPVGDVATATSENYYAVLERPEGVTGRTDNPSGLRLAPLADMSSEAAITPIIPHAPTNDFEEATGETGAEAAMDEEAYAVLEPEEAAPPTEEASAAPESDAVYAVLEPETGAIATVSGWSVPDDSDDDEAYQVLEQPPQGLSQA